ncbi:hypothetical protein JH274_13375 [Xanthomonas campestris pv. incanae]|uniref:hypothetical protein n=1 Tax=Xanthomonas campestris TaxID=339 RepID=UPI002368CBBF|nr:hypothetical protein [Xanthomonas campestris]WDK24333.1 hypothetical protein JH274_13375 [Xanthomonas campestris pv. incanae]
MAKNSTSFMNERSLEYVVVPELVRIISANGNSGAPIFFWKSREGEARSAHTHNGKMVRVVALFARRPKINEDPDIVSGKINWQLINFAIEAYKYGIPSIAAFCAGRTLFELDPVNAYWISLWEKKEIEDIQFYQHNCDKSPSLLRDDGTLITTIHRERLAQSLLAASEPMSFTTAIQRMDQLRPFITNNPYYFNAFLSSSYKPVYLLIEEPL